MSNERDHNETDRQRKPADKNKRPKCFTSSDWLRNTVYSRLPLAIQRSPKLSAGAKLLYAEYMSWAYRGDGVCRPSQAVVAWHLNVSDRQVRNLQTELEEKRAIVVVRRKAASNASKPNKILFVRDLRHLCSKERLSNKARVYRRAMALEGAGRPPLTIHKRASGDR